MNNSDRVYKELLQKNLSTLKRSMDILSRKRSGLTDRRPAEIEALRLQYKQIEEELEKFEARKDFSKRKEKKLDRLDEKADKIIAKKETHEKKIEDLQELRKKLKTAKGSRKIDKNIEHQHRIIRHLQKKNARIDFRQKVIMLPKYYRIQKKDKMLNKQQGRVNLSTDKLLINEHLQSQLDPQNSVIDRIKSVVYDIKGNHYAKKIARAEKLLKAMQEKNSIIGMFGARVTVLPKSAIEKLRRRKKRIRKNTAWEGTIIHSDSQEKQLPTVYHPKNDQELSRMMGEYVAQGNPQKSSPIK